MSAPPFASLAEAFLEEKFGIIEGSLMFEAGNWFEVTVFGITSTGDRYFESFRNEDAVRFIDEMFAWRGSE